jgi:hypothetical protein
MQIPTSVIVMSVLTAVPFGLAIRDSVKHHDAASDDDEFDLDGSRSSAREERRALERYEEEARAEEQAARESREKAKTDLAGIIGPTPASFGSMFAGLRFGVSAASAPEAVRHAVDDAPSTAFTASFELDYNQAISGLTVRLLDSCDDFDDTLSSKWGRSPDSIWVDPAAHQRASFDSIGCTLTFERFADPDQWIDNTETAIVPLRVIGQPIAKLAGKIGDTDGVETYQDSGVGHGKLGTTIDVYTKKGKIIGLSASVATDAETADLVLARLTKLFGKPKHDDIYGYSDWKGKLPIHFETTTTHLLIQAGSLPQ